MIINTDQIEQIFNNPTITMTDLANEIGVSRQTIYDWKNHGLDLIRLENLKKIQAWIDRSATYSYDASELINEVMQDIAEYSESELAFGYLDDHGLITDYMLLRELPDCRINHPDDVDKQGLVLTLAELLDRLEKENKII